MPFNHLLIFFFQKDLSGISSECLLSNSLNPDEAQHFVKPDLGPNCLKMSGLIWIEIVCKVYQ